MKMGAKLGLGISVSGGGSSKATRGYSGMVQKYIMTWKYGELLLYINRRSRK